jgi:hypothetical protein
MDYDKMTVSPRYRSHTAGNVTAFAKSTAGEEAVPTLTTLEFY